MEKKGQIINFQAIAQSRAAEPISRPAGIIRNRFLKIWSDKPKQYEDALEAYANAPQVLGDTLIDATSYTGDIGEIEEIEGPLPAHLESITKPFRIGNEYFLRRPERHEVIYVGPKQPPNSFLKAPVDRH